MNIAEPWPPLWLSRIEHHVLYENENDKSFLFDIFPLSLIGSDFFYLFIFALDFFTLVYVQLEHIVKTMFISDHGIVLKLKMKINVSINVGKVWIVSINRERSVV